VKGLARRRSKSSSNWGSATICAPICRATDCGAPPDGEVHAGLAALQRLDEGRAVEDVRDPDLRPAGPGDAGGGLAPDHGPDRKAGGDEPGDEMAGEDSVGAEHCDHGPSPPMRGVLPMFQPLGNSPAGSRWGARPGRTRVMSTKVAKVAKVTKGTWATKAWR
jgi:hypothetical protein